MAGGRKTICNMRCFTCKYPDCINNTDYVSIREQREARARDMFVKRSRLTWEQLERNEQQRRRFKEKQNGKSRVTE